jgi:hypothetical protein
MLDLSLTREQGELRERIYAFVDEGTIGSKPGKSHQ